MTPPRLRVEIGAEPYVLSSALHECLRLDPRLDVVIAASARAVSSEDVQEHRMSAPSARLTAVTEDPAQVRLEVDGSDRFIPYQGMRRLADAVVQALTNPMGISEASHV